MRSVIAALFFCLSLFAMSPAYAGFASEYGQESHSYHVRGGRAERVRSSVKYSVAGRNDASNRERFVACARYGRLQCGCTASIIAFGQIIDGLPAVSQWLARFAKTSPHVGAAAVWPGRHVEIVIAVNGDGTVDTRGSVGWQHVADSRLIFLDLSQSVRYGDRHHRRHYAHA